MKTGSNLTKINKSSLLEKLSLISPSMKLTGFDRFQTVKIVKRDSKPFGLLGNSPFILFKSEIYREFPFFDEPEDKSLGEKQTPKRHDVFIRLQQQMAFFFKWSNENRVLNGGLETEKIKPSIVNLSSGYLQKYQSGLGFLFDVSNNLEIPAWSLRPGNKSTQLIYQRVGKNLLPNQAHKAYISSSNIAQQQSEGSNERLFSNLANEKTFSEQVIKTIDQTVFSERGLQVELLKRNFSLGIPDNASKTQTVANGQNRIERSSLPAGSFAKALSSKWDTAESPTKPFLQGIQKKSGKELSTEKADAFETLGFKDNRIGFDMSQFKENQTTPFSEGIAQKHQDKAPGWLISGRNIGRLTSIIAKPFLYRSPVLIETKGLQMRTGQKNTVPVSILQLFENRPLLFNDTNRQAPFLDEDKLVKSLSAGPRESKGGYRTPIKPRVGNVFELFSIGISRFLKTNETADFYNTDNPARSKVFPVETDLNDKDIPVNREVNQRTKTSIQHQYPDTKEVLPLRIGKKNHKIPSVFYEETSLSRQRDSLLSSTNEGGKDNTGLLEKSQLKKTGKLLPTLESDKRVKTKRADLIEPPSRQSMLAQRTYMKMREILEIQESKKQSNKASEFQSTALLQKLCEQLLSDQQSSRADTKTLIQAIQGLGKQLAQSTNTGTGTPSRPFKPLHFLGPV